MDVAALIIAILAFVMASANLIVYLSKNVFSTHTIQMQPVELFGKKASETLDDNPLTEFDAPSSMDLAFKAQQRAKPMQ